MVYITILSFFGTAMAKILFNKLVQLSTPVFASSVTFVMPIVALMWGFLDGEGFSLLQGIASVIILLGVCLTHRKQQKTRSAEDFGFLSFKK
jgi:drug/metabolite transporter (DMT)-like permease